MDEVARIREKVDIVSLISEYISLKKAGRNFKALCPFHTEKTPSFIVSQERQIWHCFGGCGKGGDCFSFLMEYENLEFIEALRMLSKRTGIELQSSFSGGLSSKKEKTYGINGLAVAFYHYLLTKHPVGKQALFYLREKRKVSDALINTFVLGFSPKSGSALVHYLIDKKGYKKQELLDAGLAFERDGRLFDFFRNRVMFPLFDHRGNCVGFSGRVLEDQPVGGFGGGKYVNTKETLVYHKGDMFFGLNSAKEEIKKKNFAIVMEGEFDVISAFGEGIKNAIAIKGTSLTESQAALLSRFTSDVSLCFDQDQAGFEAMKRSLPVLEKKGFTMHAIQVKNGKDADESLKTNPVLFKRAIRDKIGIYDFLSQKIVSTFNKATVEGKRKIGETLLPFLMRIKNEIVKEHYLKKLAEELGTSYESILKEGERIEKNEVVVRDVAFVKKEKKERRELLEEYLLALIVQKEDSKAIWEASYQLLEDYNFYVIAFKKITELLSTYFKIHGKFLGSEFLSNLPKELVPAFDICFLLPLPKFEDKAKYKSEVEKVSKELRSLFLKERIKDIAQEGNNDSKERQLSKVIGLLSKN